MPKIMDMTYTERNLVRSDFILTTDTGNLPTARHMQDTFDRILKVCNMQHYGTHSLRHPYVKHTTKKFNSEKQKTQATKIVDLIAWVFCFCIVSYSKRSWTL